MKKYLTPTLALGKNEPDYIAAWQNMAAKRGLVGQRGPSWRKLLSLLGWATLEHGDLVDGFVGRLVVLREGVDKSVDMDYDESRFVENTDTQIWQKRSGDF